MKLTRSFQRAAAVLCTAAVLACGVPALAVSPADVPVSTAVSVSNTVSETQLRSDLAKFTVAYNSDAGGWEIVSPSESASINKGSCGLYPYLFLSKEDSTLYLSLGISYFGEQKLDMKSIRVETEDAYYDFSCDDEYVGFHEEKTGLWFDYEIFDMDDTPEWFAEWLSAKSVVATFTGKDGSTKSYTLTRENLQAIRDILNAYDTLVDSDASTVARVLSDMSK